MRDRGPALIAQRQGLYREIAELAQPKQLLEFFWLPLGVPAKYAGVLETLSDGQVRVKTR